MTRTEYNKLVRSKTFDVIEQNGNTPDGTEYNWNDPKLKELFKKKLIEETQELIEARASDEIVEEAADVVQVVLDYLSIYDITAEQLNIVMQAKEIKRGTFFNYHKHVLYLKHVDNK